MAASMIGSAAFAQDADLSAAIATQRAALDTARKSQVAVPSINPVESMRMTSQYGYRTDPFQGRRKNHKGLDIAGPIGTPIYATADGIVGRAQWVSGYGKYIEVEHGNAIQTRYGHLSAMNVYSGQRVRKGDIIGYVGSTGMSTGPHLHYEFRINGVHRNPLSVTMPPPEPLSGAQLAAYRTYTANALARIRTVEDIIYADVGPADDAKPTTVAAAKPAAGKKGGKG